MSEAKVTITQTADGWDVDVLHAEHVVVSTTGKEIGVDVIPEDETASVPLDVSLAPK